MKTIFLTLSLLLVAHLADAQSLPTAIFTGAAAADWTSTYLATVAGGHETNPTINKIENRVLMITAGAGMDAGGTLAWNRYVGRKHPKLASGGGCMLRRDSECISPSGIRGWQFANGDGCELFHTPSGLSSLNQ